MPGGHGISIKMKGQSIKSDANRLNAAGIHTIVIANGMQNVHSTSEYTRLSDLKRCAELTLKLMTIE